MPFVGFVSLCCFGLGGLVGAAALSGGTATGSMMAIGATDARGAIVSGLVTFVTVVVIVLFVKWRIRR